MATNVGVFLIKNKGKRPKRKEKQKAEEGGFPSRVDRKIEKGHQRGFRLI